MRNNLKRKPSWFMSTDRCPYSGLAITHPEVFVFSYPESDFSADFVKLGSNMLFQKSYGYAEIQGEIQLLAFIDDFIAKYFKSESKIVYIVYERKPTDNNMLGFAFWDQSLAKRLILVGWVERSETQHIRAGSTQPTRKQGFRTGTI
jgi:hypothetical protein